VDHRTAVVAGLIAVAVTSLLLVKALIEVVVDGRAASRSRRKLALRVRALALRLRKLAAQIEGVHTSLGGLATAVARVDEVDSKIGGHRSKVEELRAQVQRYRDDAETTRIVVVELRAQVDRLATHTRSAWTDPARLRAVATSNVQAPRLSIAIPAFERPALLAECLASVADELDTCAPGTVEVCITDDASPDPAALEVALGFAERHPYACLRVNASNVGSERNVLVATEPCRGDYLLMLGNDDRLAPNSLATILGDIEAGEAPVLLYSKQRIRQDGSPHPEVPGSAPIDLPHGETHRFATFSAAAGRQGLLSTFGFIGPAVVRRAPFVAVDPAPYLGLTMYAHVFVMAEAFADQPLFYRNVPVIMQRTPTAHQRYAGVVGRPEGDVMRPGQVRLARTLGTSLAAALERAVDRGAVDHLTLAAMSEGLFTELPLAEWIARNRTIDPSLDGRLDATVVADAERFFVAVGTSRPIQTT
jgi:hypothetical protein